MDADKVIFRNLLVHNSGLPAWRAFKDQPDVQAALQMAFDTFFSYPTGRTILHGDHLQRAFHRTCETEGLVFRAIRYVQEPADGALQSARKLLVDVSGWTQS